MLRAVSTLPAWVRSTYARHRLGLKPATVDQYCWVCLALERFAARPLLPRDFSEELVLGFLNSRLRDHAPKSVHRERQTILTLWTWAASRGEAPPVPQIPRVSVPQPLPTAWRLDELSALLEATQRLRIGPVAGTSIPRRAWWRSLILFLFDSAARIGAALAVRSADVSLSEHWAILAPEKSKTGIAQMVCLSDQTIQAIRQIWDPSRELVWPWPFHRRTLWAQFRRIRKWAGVPESREYAFHAARRSHATYAAMVDLELARQSLGHSSTSMTLKYIDPRIYRARSAVDVLPRPKG